MNGKRIRWTTASIEISWLASSAEVVYIIWHDLSSIPPLQSEYPRMYVHAYVCMQEREGKRLSD